MSQISCKILENRKGGRRGILNRKQKNKLLISQRIHQNGLDSSQVGGQEVEDEEDEEEEELVIPLPKCWSEPKNKKQIVNVTKNSSEWLRLKSDFLKGMTHTSVRITHMQPIQNSYLYKAYVIQKKLMQERNGKKQIHERTLFHGTRTTSPGLIWKSDQLTH